MEDDAGFGGFGEGSRMYIPPQTAPSHNPQPTHPTPHPAPSSHHTPGSAHGLPSPLPHLTSPHHHHHLWWWHHPTLAPIYLTGTPVSATPGVHMAAAASAGTATLLVTSTPHPSSPPPTALSSPHRRLGSCNTRSAYGCRSQCRSRDAACHQPPVGCEDAHADAEHEAGLSACQTQQGGVQGHTGCAAQVRLECGGEGGRS